MLSTVTSPIARSKFIGNNTVKYYDHDGNMYIRLHNTDIITSDGITMRLYTGGWRTVTTKDRLNKYVPGNIHIWSEKGEWMISNTGWSDPAFIAYPFYEGIKIDLHHGTVIVSKELEEELKAIAERKRLNKLIKKYCKTLKDMDTLPMPNGGDCWFCSMFERGGLDSTDHLISHLEEEYIHGSLLVNALRWAGYRPEVHMDPLFGLRDVVVRTVRRYFKAKLGFAS